MSKSKSVLVSPRGRHPELDHLVASAQAGLARAHQLKDSDKIAEADSNLTGCVVGRALGNVLVLITAETLPSVIAAIDMLPELTAEQAEAVRALAEPR